jgi:hypothetical protein
LARGDKHFIEPTIYRLNELAAHLAAESAKNSKKQGARLWLPPN